MTADLVPTDIIYPKYQAENFMIHFNPSQRWYWIPDHQDDEVLVFKAIDSESLTSYRKLQYAILPQASDFS